MYEKMKLILIIILQRKCKILTIFSFAHHSFILHVFLKIFQMMFFIENLQKCVVLTLYLVEIQTSSFAKISDSRNK